MIITCNNCAKIFEIDSSLIPEKGRLVQCNACHHKWFFKKEIIKESITSVKDKTVEVTESFNEVVEASEDKTSKPMELLEKPIKASPLIEKISIKDKTNEKEDLKEDKNIKIETSKDKKNYNILGLIIVFIISFIALIIILDTFQAPISKFVPNIEILLYNLYETINDIFLFFKDLI